MYWEQTAVSSLTGGIMKPTQLIMASLFYVICSVWLILVFEVLLMGCSLGSRLSVIVAWSYRFAKPEFDTYLQATERVPGDQREGGIHPPMLINPPTPVGEVLVESSIRQWSSHVCFLVHIKASQRGSFSTFILPLPSSPPLWMCWSQSVDRGVSPLIK